MKVNLLRRFQFLFPSVLLLSLMLPALVAGQVPLVQITNNGGVVYQSAVQVAYPGAQTAGDFNVVIVGWNDISSTINSVADSAGNIYVLAAGTVSIPLPAPGSSPVGASQAIYYAKNIVASAAGNTVTVTFNSNTGAQDVRILEYGTAGGGLDPVSPLDTSIGASATASPADSGMATTNSANDLILGSGSVTSVFTSVVKSCGTGCAMFGEPTGTGINGFGDLVEDAIVAAAGPYHAGGNFEGGGAAVMQMVAFRESGQVIPVFPAPTAASILPATSPEAGGVAVTITGTNFLAGATVMFSNGTINASGVNCTVASATTINCLTPSFLAPTTPTVVVTNVDGQATTGLPFSYTVSTPFSTAGTGSISPAGGSTNGGSFVTITGSDFAAGATVRIGGVPAYQVQVLNSTTIQAILPAGSAGTPEVLVSNPSGANGAVPGGYNYATGAGINFIQVNSTTSTSPLTNPAVTFNLPQTAGDLNVVVIGWGDTVATVKSVADSAGNTYVVAAPTVQGVSISQAIYYAKNIANSASNTVTVTFNQAATFPDVRIVEYSGLDTVNPLDAGGGAAGAGAALDSGPITLTSAGDLFIGAGDVGDIITAPGNHFATVTVTVFGNDVEHTFPSAAGPIDATATQGDGDAWVMQGVGFRVSGAASTSFSVAATALSPVSVAPAGSATSTITVTASGGFSGPVMLSCPTTGLPTGVTCNFATNPVTPGASPATSVLTVNTTANTPVGSTPLSISGTSGSVVSSATVTLVVVAAGSGNFTLTATPASQTVSPGSSGTSTITINPTGGFTGTVALACSITTTASPAPVCSLPASAATTATLTVTTTAPTAAVQHSSSIFYAMLLPIGGMTLLGACLGSRRKKALGLMLMFLMVSGLLFLAACGGGSSSSGGGGGGKSGTPAGAYTVTVTGTSGSLTAQTTTFTLTVN